MPELCCMTGLTDMARADFKVMKVGRYGRGGGVVGRKGRCARGGGVFPFLITLLDIHT